MGANSVRSVISVKRQVESDARGFETVLNPVEIFHLIRSAATGNARVELHFMGSDRRAACIALESEPHVLGLRIQLPDSFHRDARDKECMAIAFLHGHLLLCLHATRLVWEGRTLLLLPPWRAFTLQRRRQARFEIPAGYEILVDLDAKEGRRRRVQRRVIDISSGGLAFETAGRVEAERFTQGSPLRHIAIRIENRLVFADARVSREASNRGVKVGIQFTRINQSDRDFLLGYVARHLVQTYS